MSRVWACDCRERRLPAGQRRWVVTKRCCRCSAFDGYQVRSSDYSTVVCLGCLCTWRTKAGYVGLLQDEKPEEWEQAVDRLNKEQGVGEAPEAP